MDDDSLKVSKKNYFKFEYHRIVAIPVDTNAREMEKAIASQLNAELNEVFKKYMKEQGYD